MARPPVRTCVEISVESPDAAVRAVDAGADRLELASALTLGGVTPSAGLLEQVLAAVQVPVTVLVRPRPGDFLLSPAEHAVLLADVRRAVAAGAHGVAVGMLTPDGDVDAARLEEALAAAEGREVTFHRAFDAARDADAALDALADRGVARVLTAGGAASAAQGLEGLRRSVARAAGRLRVVAAGGVRAADLPALHGAGVRDVHASAARAVPSAMRHRADLASLAARAAPAGDELRAVDEQEVRALRTAADAAQA